MRTDPPASPLIAAPHHLATPASQQERVAEAIARAQRSAVSIETVNSGGPSRGAGTVVRPGYATTAAHMVESTSQTIYYAALDAQGQRTVGRATVVGVAPDLDIALLRLDNDTIPAARFSRRAPRLGDTTIVLGDPRGYENSATVGVVSGLHRNLGSPICDCVQTDAPINPGNSGAGAFNLDGELTGQVVGLLEGDQSIGFITSGTTFERVIDRLMRGNLRITEPGFTLGNLSLAQTFNSGQRVIDGPVVTATTVHGLQQYDRVLAVDGQRTTTIAEARALLALVEPGQQYRLRVARGNQMLELTLTKPR
ncbi:MAG: S1C family serine protease [Myxococcota bacterium]|nr:trypsin-like peptidase domain-containing protein [Myxococcota bacterium]